MGRIWMTASAEITTAQEVTKPKHSSLPMEVREMFGLASVSQPVTLAVGAGSALKRDRSSSMRSFGK
jgi:hypothetical protein